MQWWLKALTLTLGGFAAHDERSPADDVRSTVPAAAQETILSGVVEIEGKIAENEDLDVVLYDPGDQAGRSRGRIYFPDPRVLRHRFPLPAGARTAELGRVPVAADGSFHIPCPLEDRRVVLHVEGDHARGWLFLNPGKRKRAGRSLLTIPCENLGHVTVELRTPTDTTPEERRAMIGRKLTVVGVPDTQMSGPPHWWSATVQNGESPDAPAVLVLPRLPPWRFHIDQGAFAEDPLAGIPPFVVPLSTSDFRPIDGERSRVEVDLVRGRSLEVRVRDLDAAPVRGSGVYVGCGGRRAWTRIDGSTDAEGVARFPALPGRVNRIEVVGMTHREVTLRGSALRQALDRDTPVEITVNRGRTIHGRVLLPSGRPVEGLQIWTDGPVFIGTSKGPRRTTTDEDGRFALGGLQSGLHSVHADRQRLDLGVDGPARVLAEHEGGLEARLTRKQFQRIDARGTTFDSPFHVVLLIYE
ncbi:MAG: carboxypeptidase-like regulatory domain-containing protein [Planctomycetota bacterium]